MAGQLPRRPLRPQVGDHGLLLICESGRCVLDASHLTIAQRSKGRKSSLGPIFFYPLMMRSEHHHRRLDALVKLGEESAVHLAQTVNDVNISGMNRLAVDAECGPAGQRRLLGQLILAAV